MDWTDMTDKASPMVEAIALLIKASPDRESAFVAVERLLASSAPVQQALVDEAERIKELRDEAWNVLGPEQLMEFESYVEELIANKLLGPARTCMENRRGVECGERASYVVGYSKDLDLEGYPACEKHAQAWTPSMRVPITWFDDPAALDEMA